MGARKNMNLRDDTAIWNGVNRELWQELGTRVPVEAVREIRDRHRKRSWNGEQKGQNKVKLKTETKILLAVRQGIDWRNAKLMEMDHIVSVRDGGKTEAKNLRLVSYGENVRKGAGSL